MSTKQPQTSEEEYHVELMRLHRELLAEKFLTRKLREALEDTTHMLREMDRLGETGEGYKQVRAQIKDNLEALTLK